jgi:asparagine synthase (glutamine-hydrolysing)
LQHQTIARVLNLIPDEDQQILNLSVEEARRLLLADDPRDVLRIEGSFALVTRDGQRVCLARSLDRPLRYFLAKETDGPMLVVADRIDALRDALEREGHGDQFHPSYTRMVPAHHVTEIQLVGCPDPNPAYRRFFDPPRAVLPPDLDAIGEAYVRALCEEVRLWLAVVPEREPLGVLFSGGVDSGALLLCLYHELLSCGQSPSRLKAFTLAVDGAGEDLEQAREFLRRTGLQMFGEAVEVASSELDPFAAVEAIEDYKPLDVECAAMSLALLKGIRERYPSWRLLADGDGGDENLKDYPIEENPELTIRSVVDNLMLYQEGWGVGRIKHSLTYSGGLSRSYVRTYAPARRYGFDGFSPLAQPGVLEVAEGIPFAALTGYDVPTLYSLKGEIVRRGVRAITHFAMPVFPKRRFQHGAVDVDTLRAHLGPQSGEAAYRRGFLGLYGV